MGIGPRRLATLFGFVFVTVLTSSVATQGPTEAPTGLDGTNGYLSATEFQKAADEFESQATIAEGLGPTYTARSCAACHGQPRSGGGSQATHVFVGHSAPGFPFLGATAELGDGSPFSLVQFSGILAPRAICSSAQLRIPEPGTAEPIRSGRIALSALGDGFVEAIPDTTLLGIAFSQPLLTGNTIAGEFAGALAFETNPPSPQIGRFGWKSSLGSLLTFAALAYLGDLGITNRIFPAEVVAECDTVADPEDLPHLPVGKQGIDRLAGFLRSTKAPPRDAQLAATPDAQVGELIFASTGCSVCHVDTLQTAPAGTAINGGAFTVPPALGDKIIHPYSDFLLHDVGTGDGTVSFGSPATTANKLRTTPLWGVRFRNRLMHDGESRTFTEAILRHQGEASGVTGTFQSLSAVAKAQLIAFLKSL